SPSPGNQAPTWVFDSGMSRVGDRQPKRDERAVLRGQSGTCGFLKRSMSAYSPAIRAPANCTHRSTEYRCELSGGKLNCRSGKLGQVTEAAPRSRERS